MLKDFNHGKALRDCVGNSPAKNKKTIVVIVTIAGNLKIPNRVGSSRKQLQFGNGHLYRSQLLAARLEQYVESRLKSKHNTAGKKLNSFFSAPVVQCQKLEAIDEIALEKEILAYEPALVWCDLREQLSVDFVENIQNQGIPVCFCDCASTALLQAACYCVQMLPALFKSDKESKDRELLTNLSGLEYLPIDGDENQRRHLLHQRRIENLRFIEKETDFNKKASIEKKIVIYLGTLREKEYLKKINDALIRLKEPLFWIKNRPLGWQKQRKAQHLFLNINLKIELLINTVGNASVEKQTLLRFFPSFSEKEFVITLLENKRQTDKHGEEKLEVYRRFINCDLLITHFGITLFQALSVAMPVLLLSPTKTHLALASLHFPMLKSDLMPNYNTLLDEVSALNKKLKISKNIEELMRVIMKLSKNENIGKAINKCVLCNDKKTRIVQRGQDHNWIFCAHCKAFQRQNLGAQKEFLEKLPDYGKAYFVSEYQTSYGKTYAEDEPNLKILANERLVEIDKLLKNKTKPRETRLTAKSILKKTVLDIGAAYGFFLDVMKEAGFETFGVEYSAHAQKKAATHHRVLRADIVQVDDNVLKNKLKKKYFDAVTMWYVVEHFKDVVELLTKISQWQKSGGVLALSTPNAGGLTALLKRDKFLSESPVDHYFIFSKQGLCAVLDSLGYRLQTVKTRGVHESRYKEYVSKIFSWVPFALYKKIANRVNLGDTMDLYFVKK